MKRGPLTVNLNFDASQFVEATERATDALEDALNHTTEAPELYIKLPMGPWLAVHHVRRLIYDATSWLRVGMPIDKARGMQRVLSEGMVLSAAWVIDGNSYRCANCNVDKVHDEGRNTLIIFDIALDTVSMGLGVELPDEIRLARVLPDATVPKRAPFVPPLFRGRQ